jgi:hypothetical protein
VGRALSPPRRRLLHAQVHDLVEVPVKHLFQPGLHGVIERIGQHALLVVAGEMAPVGPRPLSSV